MPSLVSLPAALVARIRSLSRGLSRRGRGRRARRFGADRHRILTGIFARAGAQLCAGVVGGLLLALGVARVAGIEALPALLVPGTGAAMMAVGLLAAVGPAQRSLAVQPTEALRED